MSHAMGNGGGGYISEAQLSASMAGLNTGLGMPAGAEASDGDEYYRQVAAGFQAAHGEHSGAAAPVVAAAAPAAPPAAGADANRACVTAYTRAMDGALQKEVAQVARPLSGVTLEDTLSADLYYPFAWDKSDASTNGTPGAVTFGASALTAAFGGRIDFSKAVFIHSFEILERSNSAPYPLAFTMSGVQNAPVASVFKPSGESFTLLLPPGHSKMNEVVYASRNLDLEHLRAHGAANMESEYEALTPYPGLDGVYTNVLAHPYSRIGRILKKNEQLLVGPGRTLTMVASDVQMYVVNKVKALQVLAAYNKTVVSKLPSTNFLLHTGTVARLDRSAKSAATPDAPRFADAFDTPGVSLAVREHANNAKQLAFVVVRVRLIDPAKLK